MDRPAVNLSPVTSQRETAPVRVPVATPESARQRLRINLSAAASDEDLAILLAGKVEKFYNVTLAEMRSKRRPLRIAWPRQVLMTLLGDLLGVNPEWIGRFLCKDRGTVTWGNKAVAAQLDVSPELAKEVADLRVLAEQALNEQ